MSSTNKRIRARIMVAGYVLLLICSPGIIQAAPNNPPGKVFIFAQGTDKALWYNIFAGKKWQGWESLGGVIRGGPDACAQANNDLMVFARGSGGVSDSELFYRRLKFGEAPMAWVSFHTKVGSDPAAACDGGGGVHVFAHAAESVGVWHAWYDNNTWANASLFGSSDELFTSTRIGGKSLGGGIVGGPDACSWRGKRLDVFARGSGNFIYHKARNDDGTWGTWEDLGGLPMASDPSAAARITGEMSVFARDANNKLWMKSYSMTADRWSPWFPIGGMDITGSPDVTRTAPDRIDIFARGSDKAIWHTSVTFKNNIPDLKGIPAWESLGGAVASDPSAVGVDW